MTIGGRKVLVVGAGYPGKRAAYRRMTALGARVWVVDEPGHWSESLAAEGVVEGWVEAPVLGEPDIDAAAVLAAVKSAGIEPDGVLTFWEDSVSVAARVADRLGLPGNPPDAVDAARSKVRTRELSTRLGLPTPKAQRVRSLDELFAAALVIGFPAVVKPEFGAAAMGCVRVDDLDSLPNIYTIVRRVVDPDHDTIFRSGNDLLLEQYLDGVEFDIDLVMDHGSCVFSSVSQNWPTAEPSFQETGLHCPPDFDSRQVKRLVDLAIRTAQAFELNRGVLHIEGKCTTNGPRIVEVNARMGGTRIHEIVEAVWGVDLVETQLRSSLNLPLAIRPSRRPAVAAVNALVHAPVTGRLTAFPLAGRVGEDPTVSIDLSATVGDLVDGPDKIFSSVLAEVTVIAKTAKRARTIVADLFSRPPIIEPHRLH